MLPWCYWEWRPRPWCREHEWCRRSRREVPGSRRQSAIGMNPLRLDLPPPGWIRHCSRVGERNTKRPQSPSSPRYFVTTKPQTPTLFQKFISLAVCWCMNLHGKTVHASRLSKHKNVDSCLSESLTSPSNIQIFIHSKSCADTYTKTYEINKILPCKNPFISDMDFTFKSVSTRDYPLVNHSPPLLKSAGTNYIPLGCTEKQIAEANSSRSWEKLTDDWQL